MPWLLDKNPNFSATHLRKWFVVVQRVAHFASSTKWFVAYKDPATRYGAMGEEASGESKGLAGGQKWTVTSLVSYQPGSVVSRTIISDRTGTVTLFAFDEGEGLSEHTAPYDALLHLLEGEAEVTISGKMSRLEQGQAIILPAGKPHAVRASKRFKMLLTMIRSK